jgi:hypothetical protein
MPDMKIHFTLVVYLFIVSCLFSFGKIGDWVLYNSKVGNYKILMPAMPKEESMKLASAVGELTMYFASLETDGSDDNMLYQCAFSEYPTEKINSNMSKEGLDNFFNGAADASAKKMNGKVTSIIESKYKEYPGRYVVIGLNLDGEDYVALQKLILVKNRFFMLQTFTKPSKTENKNAKKFFESFDLYQ